MARKAKSQVRQFYQLHRWGGHWAKLTLEWTEHPDTPQNWKDNASTAAEQCFMAGVDKVRLIVAAQQGKSK